MKLLPIVWQRLVSPEGRTCDRCGATHREMERAIAKLEQSLRPLGIEPRLEVRELDEKSFPCCSVCGTSPCRTVEVAGVSFETIPEELFLKAALVAASQLLSVERDAGALEHDT
ncbi:DUF2703 domain-containing protein [Quisquiliibacterium transsilvanicum]|nr:DUF2703 domain-containing protein [Quisquiliibacterium transsilvanicum]